MEYGVFRDELFAYLGFAEEDAAILAGLGPSLEPRFDPIVDEFYAAVRDNPETRQVFRDEAHIEQQKGHLVAWLRTLFGGTYDAAYVKRRARIGRVHVRVKLGQRFMLAAMSLVRVGLHAALDAHAHEVEMGVEERRLSHAAIDKICDAELAIMLETYRERYTEQIVRHERLATIGQIAASIGHELRNPLAVIGTSAHLVKRRVEDLPKAKRHIGRIEQQIVVCNGIITSLLELARDRPPTLRDIALRSIVLEAIEATAREGVTMSEDVSNELRVLADASQLRQVLVNLLHNAVQALGERGGAVEVRARQRDEWVEVEVLDDGPGLSAEVLAHLFEPLFTTRAKGSGLGLALCHRVIEKHGGEISAQNREQGGALLRFALRAPRDAS